MAAAKRTSTDTKTNAPVVTDAPLDAAAWRSEIARFEKKRGLLEQRRQRLVEQRRGLALQSQQGDVDARKEAADLADQIEQTTREISDVSDAIDQANTKLADAEKEAERRLEVERAERVLELAAQYEEAARVYDRVLSCHRETFGALFNLATLIRAISPAPLSEFILREGPFSCFRHFHAAEILGRTMSNLSLVDPQLRHTATEMAAHVMEAHRKWAESVIAEKPTSEEAA